MKSIRTAAGRTLASIALVGLAACSGLKDPEDLSMLSDASIQVVTARGAGGGQGPIGISDQFTTDGAVVAFVTMVWPIEHPVHGALNVESRWYSGDRLVVRRDYTINVARSPYNFVSRIFPVNLGPGAARYELYAGGHKIAEKAFRIVDPHGPGAAPHPVAPKATVA